MKHYTVGMAGHIDHGKTTLTKALTNIDTDRLKEEKERSISIELGYAPLTLNEEMEISVIDVPGHERFVRQMIAGVTGIDLVILVVAGDEGVMPQTREHLDILRLLGIENGMIVVTKMDRIDEEMRELVELDIRECVEGTFLEDRPLFFVDSIQKDGIEQLKKGMVKSLEDLSSRDASGAFRLPIDQVFTVHGQGTVVRGTVYEGSVKEGDVLELLPKRIPVRARQLQVHHQSRESGRAGQRVAINVGGVSKDEIKRGNVLVSSGQYETTDTIDVALTTVADLQYILKQRGAIKLHIGTAEVYGKIVFFDRNELIEGNKEVLCQLRLEESVVTRRGDRFILRRPTPTETIGGGKVIDAHGGKYRFGHKTIQALEQKMLATPTEQLLQLLMDKKLLSVKDVSKDLNMSEADLSELVADLPIFELPTGEWTSQAVMNTVTDSILSELERYHTFFPLRKGMKKAEVIQSYEATFPKRLVEWVLEEGTKKGSFHTNGPFISLREHSPHPPEQWKKRVSNVLEKIREEGLQVTSLKEHLQQQIPEDLHGELIFYFHQQQILYQIDEKLSIHAEPFKQGVKNLYKQTGPTFTLQDAKEITGLSRKYLVPFVEKLDKLEITLRQEQERKWRVDEVENWLNNES
jgi:selenocysteine-specific elongation factor